MSSPTALIAAEARRALAIAGAVVGDEPDRVSALARAYAVEALMIVHPDLAPLPAVLWVGLTASEMGLVASCMSGSLWRQAYAEQIADALLFAGNPNPTSTGAAPTKPSPSTWRARRAPAIAAASPLARIIDHRPASGSATAAICGDPPPGRSAFDQRQLELSHG